MATDNQNEDILEDNTSEAALEHQSSVEQDGDTKPESDESSRGTEEPLPEGEASTEDGGAAKAAEDSTLTCATQPQDIKAAKGKHPPSVIQHKRFSTLQKVLITGILAISAILVYALLQTPRRPASRTATEPQKQVSVHRLPDGYHAQAAPEELAHQKSDLAVEQTQPASLKVAESHYLQADYDKACATYSLLLKNLPDSVKEESLRDLLQLKMAICMRLMAEHDQADQLLRTVSKSRSLVVRAIANYHRSFLEMQRKQYLNARTKAYQTIALLSAIDLDRDSILPLECDCHFLVAESTTREVLSLCDADKYLPNELWSCEPEMDPLTNLNEAQLRGALGSGSEQLSKGVLGPRIQKLERQGRPFRWSVVCHGAPADELFARFASNAGLDILWSSGSTHDSQGTEDIARRRPVSLYMPEATTQELVTAAAGCVGLLARQDDRGNVEIHNPACYNSLSEHIDALGQEAISLWQRFLLIFHGDERAPHAHFSIGFLRSERGQISDAIAEYKLVSNRFSQSSLAPYALLHSSKLRISLRDYVGARKDLRQLVEQYPDTDISRQAHFYLAEATMKAGLGSEAGQLYSKVYNLGTSVESQTIAAFGAGRCYYDEHDYEAAVEWLTRCINLMKDRKREDLYSAYLLLGKSNLALGQNQRACDAFRSALAGKLTKEKYVEATLAIVRACMQQDQFVEALDILERARSRQFSQREFTEILLLKARAFRAIGLPDKAIATLGDRGEYTTDGQFRTRIFYELAKCHMAKGDLEPAHKQLIEALVVAESGALAHEISLELARVSLKLGLNSQSAAVCLQLLDLEPSERIKQEALHLLATAYNNQKKYNRAALALLGRWEGATSLNSEEEQLRHSGAPSQRPSEIR